MQNEKPLPKKHRNSKKSKKTALTISVVTCLFMCVMGYEISRSSPKKGLEATDHFSKPAILYTNTSETSELDDNQLKVKFLTTQAQLQSQRILELKHEVLELNEQLHELRLIPFPKKEVISKTFEMKKALDQKEKEITSLEADYNQARNHLIRKEQEYAHLFKKFKSQKEKDLRTSAKIWNYRTELTALEDTLIGFISKNLESSHERLKIYNELEAQTALACCLANQLAEMELTQKELIVQSKLNQSLNNSIQKQQLRLALNHFQNDQWKQFNHKHKLNLKQQLAEARIILMDKAAFEQEIVEELSFLTKLQDQHCREIDILKENSQQKEQHLQELTKQLLLKENALTQLEQDYQKVFDDYALTQEEINNSDRSLAIAKAQIKELDHINLTLKHQIAADQMQLQEKVEDLDQVSAYSEDLTNSYFLKTEEMNAQSERLNQEIEALTKQISSYQHELTLSDGLLKEKERLLKQEQNKAASLEHDLQTSQNLIFNQKEALISLQADHQEAQNKLALLDELLVNNHAYSDNLENDYTNLKTQQTQNSLDLEKTIQQLHDAKARIASLENDLHEKEEMYASESIFLKNAKEDWEQKHQQLAEHFEKKDEFLKELANQSLAMQEQYLLSHQALSDNLDMAEKRILTLQNAIMEKDQSLNETADSLKKWRLQAEETAENVQLERKNLTDIHQIKETLTNENQSLVQRKQDLEKQHLTLMEELAVKEMLVQQIKESLAAQREQINEKEHLISQLEQTLQMKDDELQSHKSAFESKEFNLLARQQKLQEDLLKFKTKLSSLEFKLAQQDLADINPAPNHPTYDYIKDQLHVTIDALKMQLEDQRKLNQSLNQEILASKDLLETERNRVIEMQEELSTRLKDFKNERFEHESMMRSLVSELESQKETLEKIEKSRTDLSEEFEKWKSVSESP